MVFKKMLRRFGVGGPTVDTVLTRADTQPGRELTGEVNIVGGDHDVDIEHVAIALATGAETESGDHDGHTATEFARIVVSGAFTLHANEHRAMPFSLLVPWESPITAIYGRPLHGMAVGLRTELAVARAVDPGDLDPVRIHPLGCQEAVLDAMDQLGFRIKHADVETGRIAGVVQTLPFYQEIEYFPPAQYAGRITEIELTFIASAEMLTVVLETDVAGHGFASGDQFGRFEVSHAEAEDFDWTGAINGWLSDLARNVPEQRHHGDYPHEHDEGGTSMGGVVAGAAAGIVGGLVLDEVVDEIGDAFFDED